MVALHRSLTHPTFLVVYKERLKTSSRILFPDILLKRGYALCVLGFLTSHTETACMKSGCGHWVVPTRHCRSCLGFCRLPRLRNWNLCQIQSDLVELGSPFRHLAYIWNSWANINKVSFRKKKKKHLGILRGDNVSVPSWPLLLNCSFFPFVVQLNTFLDYNQDGPV